MVKEETRQQKATDIYTGNIYNLLMQLKQSYAEYEDLLAEIHTKGENSEERMTEEDKKKISYASQIIRKSVSLLELELSTLEEIKRFKPSDKLTEIRVKWKQQKTYLPDEELTKEYALQLNANITKQILDNIYTDLKGVYGG